ncbi:hypothetical protein ACGRO5_001060 [Escherichia coli]|nr:hypothetical protein [Escherichia coli]EIE1379067.1 hypothetical protein [Escherichia coli]EIG6238015.1 hypothetical protein [Escherichia coli]EIG8782865.1 hypothetical protein [Escherichia coli]EIH0290970.1 hypothetical protein [Escherichia coli]
MAYFYFKLDRVQTNKYFTKYQQTVLPLRNSILRALLKNTGAAGLRLKPFAMDVISEFYFSGALPAGWRKRDDVAFIGDGPCFIARPDESCPEGPAIAAMIETAERELRKRPDFLVWLCEKLGVMRIPSMFNTDSWWTPSLSRDALCVVFKVGAYDREIKGCIPEECQEIKHSEYVALTEE